VVVKKTKAAGNQSLKEEGGWEEHTAKEEGRGGQEEPTRGNRSSKRAHPPALKERENTFHQEALTENGVRVKIHPLRPRADSPLLTT